MLTGKVGRAVPQTGGAGTKIDELNRFDKLNEETSPHFVSLAARAVSQSRRDCVLQPRVGTLFQRHSATGLSPVVPKYRAPRLSPMPERAGLPWVSPSQNPATLKGLRPNLPPESSQKERIFGYMYPARRRYHPRNAKRRLSIASRKIVCL